MDNFMDKLAQKLNAQEMIKANAAAEAAETARLKEQNAVYEEMLHKLQTSSEQNEASAQKLEAGVVKAEQNAQKVEQGAVKVEQNAAKIEELAAAAIRTIPVVEYEKLSDTQKAAFDAVEIGKGVISQDELLAKRLPEMPSQLVPIIEEIWAEEVVGK